MTAQTPLETPEINSNVHTPRREVTRQKKLSIYQFHEPNKNSQDETRLMLMHVVGFGGALYSSKAFLMQLSIKGTIFITCTLKNIYKFIN